MKEFPQEILYSSKSTVPFTRTVFNSLWVLLIITLTAWLIQYHWRRRKLYAMASKINGPYPLPLIGNGLLFAGTNCEFLTTAMRLAAKYKCPVRFWLGQKLMFLVWKPQHLEAVLNQALEKDDLYKLLGVIVGTGLFSASVPKWKRHKKVIMPTFNQKILDGFVEVFSESSEVLVQQLKKVAGKGTFNVFDYVSRCTLDIICETAMGVKINAQTTDCNYMKWLSKAMKIGFLRIITIWYQSDIIFYRTSVGKEFQEATTNLLAFTRGVIKQRQLAYRQKMKAMQEQSDTYFEGEKRKRNTFLDQLIEASEMGDGFTDEEIREEVDTFMIAGSETAASASCFVFIMLGMYPDVQEKVYQEVISVLGQDRPVQYTDLGNFVYLERVIKETMRLFPPGPVTLRSVTEDIKLDNCVLPAGSTVAIGVMPLHRDPEVWPNPLEFNPDRFLPEEVAKRHPSSFLPFLGGPRYCVGSKFGMMNLKATMATVVRTYRICATYKNIEDIEIEDNIILRAVNENKIYIELRT